jgi:hypothetical protein
MLSSQLSSLWLQENRLQGTLPTEMALLTSLEELLVYSNQLTGTVPEEVCSQLEDPAGSLQPPLNLTVDCGRLECGCGCYCNANESRRTL